MVIFNPIDADYIVSWQSDLENTKESIFPVCDKSYHKIKQNMPLGEELEKLWNYPYANNVIVALFYFLISKPLNWCLKTNNKHDETFSL